MVTRRRSTRAPKWREPGPAADHLMDAAPKTQFVYVSREGKRLFDNRYQWPPNPKPPQKSQAASAAMGPKRSSQGQFTLGEPIPGATSEDDFHARPSIRLPIPDHIKAILVDDWENITKNNQLVPIPHARPVDKIITDYLEYERPNRDPNTAHLDILEETMAGLKEYFEKALGRILLYRFERPQYHEMRKVWDKAGESDPNKGVCDTYGAEHLCRLLASLPELVAQTTMDQQSAARLNEELSKFMVWLGRHTRSYFASEYETPSQEYTEHARGF